MKQDFRTCDHFDAPSRLMTRSLRLRPGFVDSFGTPEEAENKRKSGSDAIQNERSKNGDFCYASFAKSLFWDADGGQDGA